MNTCLNIGKRLNRVVSFKSSTTFLRSFQSATTGESFGHLRETSPFLKTPTEICQLPYYVRRTRFLSLPIYSDFKNGGTRHETLIRRVQGSVAALKEDILKEFPDWQVSINPITKHIVIKGIKVHQVRDFLTVRGF